MSSLDPRTNRNIKFKKLTNSNMLYYGHEYAPCAHVYSYSHWTW